MFHVRPALSCHAEALAKAGAACAITEDVRKLRRGTRSDGRSSDRRRTKTKRKGVHEVRIRNLRQSVIVWGARVSRVGFGASPSTFRKGCTTDHQTKNDLSWS